MYSLDAQTEQFEAVEILGIPGLFTTERISRASIPPGLFLYEMQTSEEDWSQPCLLGRSITAGHFGTVLTASPVALPQSGYIDLKPGDFDELQGTEYLTVASFEEKYLSPCPSAPRRQQSKVRHVPAR